MTNRWKKPVIALAVIVGLAIVLQLVLTRLVPADRILRTACEQTEQATGAEVDLDAASVRLWPRIALTVGAGRITGTGAALAAKTGSATTIERFDIGLAELAADLKIGPLVRGRIETGAIRLACPDLEIADAAGVVRAENLEAEVTDLQVPAKAVRDASTAAGRTGGANPTGEMIPTDLSLDFALRAGRVFWQGVPYDGIAVDGELDGRVVLVESFSAERAGGRMSGEAEVDFERDPWGILEFEAVAEAVPAGALLEPWASGLAQKLECDLEGEVSGGCGLKDPETTTRTLDLTGRLHAGEGVLHAAEWLDEISSYLGERQDLKDIRFSVLEHSFRVSKGKYLIEDLSLEGPDTDWTGDGWVGLDGTIDVNLHVKLPEGFTPDLGQLSFLAEGLRDEEGRVNLTLHLTGEAARPSVGLKLAGAREAGKSQAADAVKKGLGGFLDKLKTK